MGRRAALWIGAAVLILTGCAWPTQNEPYCFPKAKYQRATHGAYLGVRCGW